MQNKLKMGRGLILAVLLLSFMSLRMVAQGGNARITGTVTDNTGAAIPGPPLR